jgi:glyoxylase-like metal-dependent hydrolase (beta-lactamase superfamily II)
MKAAPNVFFVEGEGSDSNTVIVLGEEPFIVDTGTGLSPQRLAHALAQAKLPEPQAIVNTHCHFDHVGGNHLFHAQVWAGEPDAKHIADADAYCAAKLFGCKLEKQRVEPLGKEFRGWRVIETPGHTPGSVCLLKDGVLISGDTLFAEGHGRTDLLGGDEAAMERSLAKIIKLEYSTLLPGHGPPLSRGQA